MFSTRLGLSVLLVGGAAVAQQYVISTVAGGAPPPSPSTALNASIGSPSGIAVDQSENIYFTSLNNCIFKLAPSGSLTLLAGNARLGYFGDGGLAVNARFQFSFDYAVDPIAGLAIDKAGNLYVADSGNNRVRSISASGLIATVAGNGAPSYSGDGGPATAAGLNRPSGLAIDNSGNLYIADTGNNRVRKVTDSGVITTVAGNGQQGFGGDGSAAIDAQLNSPQGLAVDSTGRLYIADSRNERVRKLTPDGIILTVAGIGTYGYSGDGGPATNSQLGYPTGVSIDADGNLYIAEAKNQGTIRRVSGAGQIDTLASGLNVPLSLVLDASGTLYVTVENELYVKKVSPAGIVSAVAGNGTFGYSGDGGLATAAQINYPQAVSLDNFKNLYIADSQNRLVRKVSSTGIMTTVAGGGCSPFSDCNRGDGGQAVLAGLRYPTAVAADTSGNFYVTDDYSVRKISSAGIITTVAGNGAPSYSGDGGPATAAGLNQPGGLAIDSSGNLYIADTGNHRVRKVTTTGIITTVAGNGQQGFGGDGGASINAHLNFPQGLAVDSTGNLYIADSANLRIRRVSPSLVITTVAGDGTSGHSGDNGLATSAQLLNPTSVSVDKDGRIYIADAFFVRSISPAGTISTIAGSPNARSGNEDYSGDGGPATAAALFDSAAIAVDSNGNIYVADSFHNAIRYLQPIALGISAVTNAASSISGPIAPGEIVTTYGSGLGPSQLVKATVGDDGLIDKQLAGTTVSFNGIAAPMIYTWATQVSAIVPYGITGTTATVTVSYQGQTTAAVSVPISSSAPGIFTLDSTGSGPGAVVNQDGSINTAATPAKTGDIISIYATGEGQTSPTGVDGKPASIPLPQPNLPVTVTIGGQLVQPQYAGGAFGEVAGLIQINAQIPSGIQTGNAVPVVILVGGVPSQAGVTIAVR